MASMRSEVRTATTDPAAGEMRCRMSRKMSAATAETRTAAATTKMGTTAATTKMGTTAATAMSATATAAPGISNSRQTKGKAYCGRACCDFPHDMTSSSGPNAGS
jgi:hypothetical protein